MERHQMQAKMPTSIPVNGVDWRRICGQLQSVKFDLTGDSHYSTRTCRGRFWNDRRVCIEINGLYVHFRDVYLLLSERFRAGVFNGLNSELKVSDHRRPTALLCAVGLCFLI